MDFNQGEGRGTPYLGYVGMTVQFSAILVINRVQFCTVVLNWCEPGK